MTYVYNPEIVVQLFLLCFILKGVVGMVDRKSITVHYRRLEDPVGAMGGISLEAALRSAMACRHEGALIKERVNNRAWAIPNQDDTFLMNLYHDDGVSYFGDLTQYTTGFLQALLNNEPEKPVLSVEQQPPPEGKEYIHSMMYWMVIGNHLMAIQSRSLSSKHLEEYLTWLLKERTGAMGENGHVILNAKFDRDEMGGDMDDVKDIIVGGVGAVEAAPIVLNAGQEQDRVREVDRHVTFEENKPWGERAIEVLKAVMRNDADVSRLLADIPEGADLDVSVHIGYKTKSRRVSRAPMQQVLRNLPEGEITASGKYGRSRGKDIRLSYPARIITRGSLLDPDDAKAKLRDAYDYFVNNGKIDP